MSAITVKRRKVGRKKQRPLGDVLQGLSHPHRLAVLRYIVEHGEGAPVDIAKELGEPLNSLSYHVRELQNKGLIVLKRSEPARGTLKHFYRAVPQAKELLRLIDAMPSVPA